ncbi:protease [Bacillus sp. AFS015802]|uniref:immune inhibitor A domain-containing protein n=1 Tax=Bacillus sp. AFS015802 TaxID=2033486 RepID=UPI000BF75F07|nr:immune inhibitor A domain-containing protein [Bacillus sp. AFS015802]PFA66817.1 protease [Bacillus sp. AFS015802]
MLGLSTLAVGPAVSTAQSVEMKSVLNEVTGKSVVDHGYHDSTFDLGIANDERLIDMLKKEGKIAVDASPAQAEKALSKYLKSKAEGAKKSKAEKEKNVKLDPIKEVSSNGVTKGKGNKLGQAKKGVVASVKEEKWEGAQSKDNLLILLIEFDDFKASDIKEEYTDMYYEDYTPAHYEDMLFNDESYAGPNGEKLISMKRFYEEQSGGSYSVDGHVSSYWYKAKHDAAYYGGNNSSDNDSNPGELIKEALAQAAQDPSINLSDFDQDGDHFIDQLMVVHSSVGEEAGGGELGEDAIWSHKSSIYDVIDGKAYYHKIPGTDMYAYGYTIQPADGAAGVFTHEFGHALGLPDEYDTIYSGAGEAVSYWSIMASGSWAGNIPGTEPTGFSAWSKEFLQSTMPDSNWLKNGSVSLEDVNQKGVEVLLDEAVTKGTNNDAVRVDLPDKVNVINKPVTGEFEYYGGKGDEADHKMVTTVDLTSAANATLDYDIWYETEENWDYGMVQVSVDGGGTWESLSTPNTNSDLVEGGYPAIQKNLPGYTGSSNGWLHESIDLSAYAGQEIQLQFRSMTDWGANLNGIFVDNVSVKADGTEILFDGAEGEDLFTLDGFKTHTGSYTSPHYYLLEWRSQNGVDEGLGNIRRGASLMSFDPGLVVWYVDEAYGDNWTGSHPGDGFLGVVDADQHTNYWSDGTVGTTRYQIHDAAFSLNKSEKMFLDYPGLFTMKDNFTKRTPLFDDSLDYSNPGLVDAGRNVPNYGLKFRVTGESVDGTVGKVLIYK